MTDEWSAPAEIEVLIHDRTLDLAELNSLTAEMHGHWVVLRITNRTTAPASEGPEEIAVQVFLKAVFVGLGSEVYKTLKGWMLTIYSKIDTRPATRYYIEGALALSIQLDTESDSVVNYRLPEGLSLDEVTKAFSAIEALAADERLFSEAQGMGEMVWSPELSRFMPRPSYYPGIAADVQLPPE